MATDEPSLIDAIREAVTVGLGSVETAMPGRIVDYDHTQQRASVRLMVKAAYKDAVTGERTLYEMPIIHGAPVAFPQASGYAITWPLTVGDRVLVVFASRDISAWLENNSEINEPADPRRHDLNDAVVIPGMASFADPIDSTGRDSSAMVIKGGEIRIGSSSASQFVALANLVLSELQAIWLKFNTHTHIGVTTGPGVSGIPSDITGSASSVAATKVKAE